ncbi:MULTISPECIES: dihydroorotase [Pontibacillus]|uniref:Dihydroorotase n=1 Tax=Pontibacillus chungwhensis TaxID=265426 RepID=A0ABY8V368_9BACI|nr:MULTISPECIES: dihydroorotase [Pontibacillus]MCD5322615.1 dihydroorotase [Pontibacillus sp. HN14]WIF99898.1 dihydroorotase [Pontibacillus chungwhensis]
MRTLLKNIHTLQSNEKTNLIIEGNTIQGFTTEEIEADQIIDGKGKIVAPGFVDVHIHLREPGGEAKETIETGTRAAARGGFTTVCAMPNTRPVPDCDKHMNALNDKIKTDAAVRVLPYASITTRQLGSELVDMKTLKELGAFAFTDDGVGVQSANMMLEAMKQASALNMAVVAHCEDNNLIQGGVMHNGRRSEELNLPGIPSICESVQIARDVLLAEATGCHYHVCHVSTKESVRVIRDAKRAGIPVTAEVTPHHLLLTEEDIPGDDALFKMNPPLRAKEDQLALIEGLEDGTIDFIATDHAPHTEEEKNGGFLSAPFGIVGLETAFSLLNTYFVKTGRFTLGQLVDWMSVKPARVFGLTYGTLKEGAPADLVLLDPDKAGVIDKRVFASKGTNTPFDGWDITGEVELTMVDGEVIWKGEDLYETTTNS